MFCPNCGAQISDKAVVCVKCGMGIPQKKIPAASASGDSELLRCLIPVGRSVWAIIAGYLGLLSFIPGVGVLAIAFGIMAIHDIKQHPDKHGLGRAWCGIILGALSIPIWCLIVCV
ncbi:MAG: DUF4190 domain-containing protein [Kiritimatiellia bacterium]